MATSATATITHCALILVLVAIGRVDLLDNLLQVLRHPLHLGVYVLRHLEPAGGVACREWAW